MTNTRAENIHPLHNFVAGWLGGCAGLLVGHPFDTVRVRIQIQGGNIPLRYSGAMQCLVDIIKNESILGLYKGFTFPLIGYSALATLLFGVQKNVMTLLQPTEQLPRLTNTFLAGTVAGFAEAIIATPIELVKIGMQMQNIGQGLKAPKLNPVKYMCKIVHDKGVGTLLTKGLWTTIIRDGPGYGVFFVTFDTICLSFLSPVERNDRSKNSILNLSPWKLLVSGGVAGVVGWCITYPFDVIKSRLQIDVIAKEQKYRGLMDCMLKTYKLEGYRPFVAGLSLTAVTSFPVSAVTFLVVTIFLKYVSKVN